MKRAVIVLLAMLLTGCASSDFRNEVFPAGGDRAIFVSWYGRVGIAVQATMVAPAAAASGARP